MVFYRILDAAPVASWQVIREPEQLRLRLSGRQEFVDEATLVETVRQALEQQGAMAPPITVQWLESVARGATGKVARIVSKAE